MRLSGVRSSESADKGSKTLNPRLYEFSEFLLVGRGLASMVRQWYVNMKCIHPNPGVTTKISARLRMVCSDFYCLRPLPGAKPSDSCFVMLFVPLRRLIACRLETSATWR
jgi:hypothetical protein